MITMEVACWQKSMAADTCKEAAIRIEGSAKGFVYFPDGLLVIMPLGKQSTLQDLLECWFSSVFHVTKCQLCCFECEWAGVTLCTRVLSIQPASPPTLSHLTRQLESAADTFPVTLPTFTHCKNGHNFTAAPAHLPIIYNTTPILSYLIINGATQNGAWVSCNSSAMHKVNEILSCTSIVTRNIVIFITLIGRINGEISIDIEILISQWWGVFHCSSVYYFSLTNSCLEFLTMFPGGLEISENKFGIIPFISI